MLALAGLVALVFFWATDPRFGILRKLGPMENPVDAANQSFIGTIVGVAGSLVVLTLGVWLMGRRPA